MTDTKELHYLLNPMSKDELRTLVAWMMIHESVVTLEKVKEFSARNKVTQGN